MHWRQKPAGWPEYMVSKTLARGEVGYYWQPPTWARARGCLLGSEALGAGTILLPTLVWSSVLLIRFRQSGRSLPMGRKMITTVFLRSLAGTS